MQKKLNYDFKYPTFSRKENKACKLTDQNIIEIKEFYKQKVKNYKYKTELYKDLAEKYNVSPLTIKYWCDSNFQEATKKLSRKKSKQMWKENPEVVKKRIREYKKEWRARKPEWKKYNNDVAGFYNKQVRKFINLHKKEFEEFLKTN